MNCLRDPPPPPVCVWRTLPEDDVSLELRRRRPRERLRVLGRRAFVSYRVLCIKR